MTLDEMRKVAEAATPGARIANEIRTSCGRCFRIGTAEQIAAKKRGKQSSYACLYDDYGAGENQAFRDARYIATFDPPAVLKLLDCVELLKRCKGFEPQLDVEIAAAIAALEGEQP